MSNKIFGGVSCPTILWWPQFRESVSNNILFWGEASLLSNMWIFSPKDWYPRPQTIQKITPTKNHDNWGRYPTYGNMGWFTDTNHHAPPGPPVPRHHVWAEPAEVKGELRGHKMSDAWEILTRTIVNLIKIDFLIYILCIIVHNTYDNTVQVYSYIHICICIYCCCCDHLYMSACFISSLHLILKPSWVDNDHHTGQLNLPGPFCRNIPLPDLLIK